MKLDLSQLPVVDVHCHPYTRKETLTADEVRAEQTFDDLATPGKLRIDLVTRERDVVEKADPDVAA